ncbi:MAG: malate dehydrogenase [Tenericutes bacterium GWF2_57_13]|nr:MAG: malate dehydrogenase [Tenericutes bacterium GWF2_57_13]
MNEKSEAILLHEQLRGKIEITPRIQIRDRRDLSLAYTPGVAEPCLAIQRDPDLSYVYTRRHNTVAVITDGTAVLGLGDIGPEAGMPVMEGKALLFKTFGDVDAIPLCLRTKDPDEIVRTVSLLAGSFGGINLEDIASPRCFEIETRLKAICDIPVFHDDQHGTAVVVGAAVVNALKVVKKELSKVRVVINGAGAAGQAIAYFLLELGVTDMIVCDRFGILVETDPTLIPSHLALAKKTNRSLKRGVLRDAFALADVFVGVSGPNCVDQAMIRSMRPNAIVFPLANPISEISREDALAAGAAVVGTGSSKFPNQINNLLVFPGIFRGALDVRAKDINIAMMKAASQAIAACVSEDSLTALRIIPSPFEMIVHEKVAEAVRAAAVASGVARVAYDPTLLR